MTGALRLLLLSDTHVPNRASDLPAELWQEVAAADAVVHAGDWVSESLLDTLTARSRQLIGVWGNNDGPELRRRLPEVAQVELAGVQLAVLHDSGSVRGREQRLSTRFPRADLVVFGHSHIPWDSSGPTGTRLLNPGSPTDRRQQPAATFLTASLAAGRVEEVILHRLDDSR